MCLVLYQKASYVLLAIEKGSVFKGVFPLWSGPVFSLRCTLLVLSSLGSPVVFMPMEAIV